MTVANPVTVPRLGWSMEEGTFVEWLKRDGDDVRVGDPLFVLEGEKAAESIEAIDSGVLRLTPESPAPGTVVMVGQFLAWILGAGETVHPAANPERERPEDPAPAHEALVARAANTVAAPAPGSLAGDVAITPRARRAARERGVAAASFIGTGRGGRIRERDVIASAGSSSGRLIPHSRTRRTIAARMVAGVTVAAPVTLTTKVEATGLVQWRARLKQSSPVAPSYNDLLVMLTVATLKHHPMLQAQWRDDGLWVPEHTNIAVAVDTDAGLLTPVLREADTLSLSQLAGISRDLIERARTGRLSADALRDATFTITNLGVAGIDAFTPIISLPQCAVLGVGRIVREPVCMGDAIIASDMVTLSLTFDHRVIDGAPAARFLQDLGRAIMRGEP